jgi:hypothetical protein
MVPRWVPLSGRSSLAAAERLRQTYERLVHLDRRPEGSRATSA